MGSVRMTPTSGLVCLLLSLLAAGLAGCVSLPFYTSANQALPTIGAPRPTRATLHLQASDLPAGTFIGVAMSGGGSRAANFSAAVLFELERLGLLPDHVSAISSVSGSSLTAAYYGLYGRLPNLWNPERFKKLLLTNFEVPWILRWFLPHNMFRYVVTDFDRSDIMRGVFDDVLFHRRTFDEMGAARPKIIINAAALGSVPVAFQFTEERFREFGSRLDTYPVSAAVVASGAFPGALHPVTLRNYLDAQRPFTHLYDGGVFDNLGVTPLIHIAENLTDPKGCLLIVVDAHQEYEENPKYQKRRDPRTLIDYFIDTNVIDAAGSLTSYQRTATLHLADPVLGLGLNSDTAQHPVQLSPRPKSIPQQRCLVWLVSFNRLHWISARFTTLQNQLNQIATRYTLTSPTKQTPREIQTSLYEAANILVQQDPEALAELCSWLRPRAIHLPRCMSKSDTN